MTTDGAINEENEEEIKEIVPGLGGASSPGMQRASTPIQNIAAPIVSFDGNNSQDNF